MIATNFDICTSTLSQSASAPLRQGSRGEVSFDGCQNAMNPICCTVLGRAPEMCLINQIAQCDSLVTVCAAGVSDGFSGYVVQYSIVHTGSDGCLKCVGSLQIMRRSTTVPLHSHVFHRHGHHLRRNILNDARRRGKGLIHGNTEAQLIHISIEHRSIYAHVHALDMQKRRNRRRAGAR